MESQCRGKEKKMLPRKFGIDTSIYIGRQLVQLFYHTNIDGFLLFPLESRKVDTGCLSLTPRASPVSCGNWKETHIQTTRNKSILYTNF
jgi:hypothetical protein